MKWHDTSLYGKRKYLPRISQAFNFPPDHQLIFRKFRNIFIFLTTTLMPLAQQF